MNLILTGIVAISKNGIIGKDGGLPWSFPNDLKLFRRITNGHPVVMGRKTYESIRKLLPSRQNIILTRDKNYKVEGATIIHDPSDIYHIENLKSNRIFIIGGASIYQAYFSHISEWYVSRVHYEVQGDTYLDYDFDKWCQKQELVYSDEDFTTTHYVRDHSNFGREIYTHSLDSVEEHIVTYGKKDEDRTKNLFGKEKVKEESLKTPTHNIHLTLWNNGQILFYGVPNKDCIERTDKAVHPFFTRFFFEVVRPIEVMGYSMAECNNSFIKIWQYIKNLFSDVENCEPVYMDKDVADAIYDKMIRAVSKPSIDYPYNNIMGITQFVGYNERIKHHNDINWFDGDFGEELCDALIETIVECTANYLDSFNGWEDLLHERTYKNVDTIKKLCNGSLSNIKTVVENVYNLLTFSKQPASIKANCRSWIDNNNVIERSIIKIHKVYNNRSKFGNSQN